MPGVFRRWVMLRGDWMLRGAGFVGWWRLSLAPALPQSSVTSWPPERSRWRRDADGGTVAAALISFRWQRQAEAERRPVAGTARGGTWHRSAWHTWGGLPVPGHDSFPGLPCLQMTWYLYRKHEWEKNQKDTIDLVLPLES